MGVESVDTRIGDAVGIIGLLNNQYSTVTREHTIIFNIFYQENFLKICIKQWRIRVWPAIGFEFSHFPKQKHVSLNT